MNSKENPFRVTGSRRVYEGNVINLRIDELISPLGRKFEREVVEHLQAVGVIAVTDDDRFVMVRQYRHAIGSGLIEIPAGLLQEGEDPAQTAIRELREETGYKAVDVRKIAEFYTSAGFTDERFHLFLADAIEAGESELEPGEEDLQVEEIPVDDLFEMAIQGKIEDGKTLIAVLMYKGIHGYAGR